MLLRQQVEPYVFGKLLKKQLHNQGILQSVPLDVSVFGIRS